MSNVKNIRINGFTLAEVLITLTIIGIIATISIPGLINDSQKNQKGTKLKKGFVEIQEAIRMAMVNSNCSTFDCTGIISDETLTGSDRIKKFIELGGLKTIKEKYLSSGCAQVFKEDTNCLSHSITLIDGTTFAFLNSYFANGQCNGTYASNQMPFCYTILIFPQTGSLILDNGKRYSWERDFFRYTIMQNGELYTPGSGKYGDAKFNPSADCLPDGSGSFTNRSRCEYKVRMDDWKINYY